MAQAELARRCNVSGPTVHQWLQGYTRPDDLHRELIQTVTGVDKALWENGADRKRAEMARRRASSRASSPKRAPAASG